MLNNDSKEARNIRRFIEECRERIGEDKTATFVNLLKEALDRVEEANGYT